VLNGHDSGVLRFTHQALPYGLVPHFLSRRNLEMHALPVEGSLFGEVLDVAAL